MTVAQRKVHLLIWLVLGPVAAVGLMLAINWRPAPPVQDGPLPGVEAQSHEPPDDPEVSP